MNVIELFLVAWEMDEVTKLLADHSFCQFISYWKVTLKVYCHLMCLKRVLETSNVYVFSLGLWLNDWGEGQNDLVLQMPLYFFNVFKGMFCLLYLRNMMEFLIQITFLLVKINYIYGMGLAFPLQF